MGLPQFREGGWYLQQVPIAVLTRAEEAISGDEGPGKIVKKYEKKVPITHPAYSHHLRLAASF